MEDTQSDIELLTTLKEEFDLDSDAMADTLKRIEYELRFSLGTAEDHWDEKDDSNRGAGRARLAIPLINTKIIKAVSRFEVNPFGIVVDTDAQDEISKAKAKIKQFIIRGIESKSKAKTIYANALKHSLACGFGYWYATTADDKGKTVVTLEPIDDPRCVTLSRDTRKPDGSDSSTGYYRTKMSLSEAKRKYGQDVVDAHGSAWMPKASSARSNSEVDCVYIWQMDYSGEKPKCNFYKIVCNKIVDRAELNVRSIPLFRVAGNSCITKDKPTYIGKAHNAIGANKLVDYMASMTLERLGRTPVPAYRADASSIANDPESWDNANQDIVSVRRYDAYDDQGRQLPAPEREEDTLRIGELTNGMVAFNSFLNDVIGTNESIELPNQTAEEALLKERNSERTDSEIYSHLEDAICACGYVLSDLIDDTLVSERMLPIDDGTGLSSAMIKPEEVLGVDVGITVEAGVMRQADKKEKLQKSLALAPMLGADSKIVWGDIAQNVDDLSEDTKSAMMAISKQYAESLVSGSNGQNAEAQAQAMAQMQSQIADMQSRLDQANNYIQQQDAKIFALEEDSKINLLIKQMDSDTKIFIERIKQAGSDARLQAEIENERELSMAKLLAEMKKQEATQPQIKVVNGFQPDYNSVQGLNNKPF